MYYKQRNAPWAIRQELRKVVDPAIKVRAELEDGWTVDDGPQVTVTGDGTPSRGRATAGENVRINVYARFEPDARDLASQIDAFLLNPANVLGFVISPGPGLLCVRDADTGGWVSSVTVVADSTNKGV